MKQILSNFLVVDEKGQLNVKGTRKHKPLNIIRESFLGQIDMMHCGKAVADKGW